VKYVIKFISANEAMKRYKVNISFLCALKRLGFIIFRGYKYVDEDGLASVMANRAIVEVVSEILAEKPYVYFDANRLRSLFRRTMLRKQGLIGTGDIARMFGRSYQWANNVARRKLNSVRIGKRRFIKMDEKFFEFIDNEMNAR